MSPDLVGIAVGPGRLAVLALGDDAAGRGVAIGLGPVTRTFGGRSRGKWWQPRKRGSLAVAVRNEGAEKAFDGVDLLLRQLRAENAGIAAAEVGVEGRAVPAEEFLAPIQP